MTDAALERDITRALLEDERLAEHPIEVHAHLGIVTLRGVVQNHRRKLAAYELASANPGCKSVRNELDVHEAPVPPDRCIAQHVHQALAAHPQITETVISIECKAGHVTLMGHVASTQEKALIEDVALGSQGVRSVANLLSVDAHRHREDQRLGLRMRAALDQVPELQHADIEVTVAGNVASLFGTVRRATQRELAERTIQHVRMQSTRNHIVVDPHT